MEIIIKLFYLICYFHGGEYVHYNPLGWDAVWFPRHHNFWRSSNSDHYGIPYKQHAFTIRWHLKSWHHYSSIILVSPSVCVFSYSVIDCPSDCLQTERPMSYFQNCRWLCFPIRPCLPNGRFYPQETRARSHCHAYKGPNAEVYCWYQLSADISA
jgi:hypothetical protein